MKNIRQVLREGGYAVGSWVNTCSPVAAELMAAIGFDFLAVDAEHSALDIGQVQCLFQAIRSGNGDCAPMVRLPGSDYAVTKRFLDAGAAGVIAPLINSAEQAQQVVSAVKYPPAGARGVGFCRDNMYGLDFDSAVASANERTLLAVQVEHIEAVQNIDEILSVKGIDAVFIGPYDLCASMGIMRQFDHPKMVDATGRILDACKAHNVAPGIHVVQPDVDETLRRIDEGYRLIAYSLDITMLAESCQAGLEAIRKKIGRAS